MAKNLRGGLDGQRHFGVLATTHTLIEEYRTAISRLNRHIDTHEAFRRLKAVSYCRDAIRIHIYRLEYAKSLLEKELVEGREALHRKVNLDSDRRRV